MKPYIVILIISTMLLSCQSKGGETFIDKHQRYPRVRTAISEKDSILRKRFEDKGLIYPPQNLFIRVFKQEKVLEVWTLSGSDGIFKKVFNYPICRTSGVLGPKDEKVIYRYRKAFIILTGLIPKAISIFLLESIILTILIRFWVKKVI